MRPVLTLLMIPLFAACAASNHEVERAQLGTPRSSDALWAIMATPGPVTVETVHSADWAVERKGLINLDHPVAKAAGLKDGDEPIFISFHAIRHPTQGLFIVDTGIERAFKAEPGKAAVRGVVAWAMKPETVHEHVSLGGWLSRQPTPLAGVLFTHLHLDHVMGTPDVPTNVPLFAGPGETTSKAAMNVVSSPCINRALEGHGPIHEWAFAPDPAGRFSGVLDVFGDETVWALWVPGHTSGSTAYLVRTPTGPVLLTGDASHTAWGWEHDVEPGTFSVNGPQAAESLRRLRDLAAAAPGIDVRFGHQDARVQGQSGVRKESL